MGTEKCVCVLLYKEYILRFSFFFGKTNIFSCRYIYVYKCLGGNMILLNFETQTLLQIRFPRLTSLMFLFEVTYT